MESLHVRDLHRFGSVMNCGRVMNWFRGIDYHLDLIKKSGETCARFTDWNGETSEKYVLQRERALRDSLCWTTSMVASELAANSWECFQSLSGDFGSSFTVGSCWTAQTWTRNATDEPRECRPRIQVPVRVYPMECCSSSCHDCPAYTIKIRSASAR